MSDMKNKLFIFILTGLILAFQFCETASSRIEVGGIEQSEFQSENPDLPNMLNFNDLIKLSNTKNPDEQLKNKLNYVLNAPMVDNSFANKNTKFNKDFIRVASWNINRGLNIEAINKLFSSPDELVKTIKNPKADIKKVKEQIEALRSANIIILNEVDIGMPRTGYKNIAKSLAEILGYNYAYGVEFVETDPSHLGLENNKWSEERILFPDKDYKVEKEKYKGLHGNAILSRFPLKNVRIIRLPAIYGWFETEQKRIAEIEYLRRKASDKIFKEDIIREIRHGNRMALLADIDIPELDKPVTIIATHFENRAVPEKRFIQMQYLLNAIKSINNPVILAGDFNTTSSDGSPTTIRRELSKKLKDPEFYIRQAIYYSLPYTLAISSAHTITNKIRINKNPTVKNIPVISPNKERKFFTTLKRFKFSDGGQFDFSGDRNKSSNGRKGLLANSNQRDLKGFTPTFIFERPLYIGKFKLDWIFVKPLIKEDKTVILKPFNGMTLLEMNYAFEKLMADHSPVTVDLSLCQSKELKK